MPKRGKKKQGDGRDEYEGRPANLTFGAFLQTPQSSVELSLQTDVEPCSGPSQDGTETCENPREEPTEEQAFFVTRTKKGKLPITYENRSKGKKVTVISNVSGNSDILLSELRKRLGVGGVSRGAFVELQGDQQKAVTDFLNSNRSCLK